ncbi:hypothetical protein D9M69_593630 [compost metagenome]
MYAAGFAFGQQQGDQVLGRAVAEQLALVLLMETDAVFLHQRDEVGRRVARERRAAEVRVLAQEVFVRRARIDVAVGEVGPAAARDADLLRHLFAVVEHQHAQAALARDTGTEKTGRTRADDDGVEILHGAQCRRRDR